MRTKDSKTVHSLPTLRKKEGRGKFLTALIILEFYFAGVGLKDFITLFISHQFQFTLYEIWSLLFTLLTIIALIGILRWQVKAVYLFLFLLVSTGIIELFTWDMNLAPLVIIITLVHLTLWLYIVGRKWNLFT